MHNYCRWKTQNNSKMESDDKKTSNPLIEKVKSKVVHYFQRKRQKPKHPLRIMVILIIILILYMYYNFLVQYL